MYIFNILNALLIDNTKLEVMENNNLDENIIKSFIKKVDPGYFSHKILIESLIVKSTGNSIN